MQHPLDVVEIVALLQQRECESAGPTARAREWRFGEGALGPDPMLVLQRRREPSDMPAVHGRHGAPDRVPALAHPAGEVELHQPVEAAHDG